MAGFTHSTTKRHVYGCSVPRLTRFTGSVCMGPGHDALLFTICYLPTAIDHHITTSRQYSKGGGIFQKKIGD